MSNEVNSMLCIKLVMVMIVLQYDHHHHYIALYTTLNIEDNIKESNCEVKTFDCLSTKMKKVKTRYKS